MSRYRIITAFAVLLSFGLLVAGCGGGGGQDTTSTTQDQTMEPAATGSLVATVNFEGEAPETETYDASGNPECEMDQIESRSVVVNDNGTLQNVVVAVESGPSVDLPAPDVSITQEDCMYQPHVSVAKVGQSISVGDEDSGMHNVRGSTMEGGNQLFNLTTFQGQTKSVTIENAGIVSLECDVHPWMQGWIYVTDNGAAAVTGEQGTASLSDLPTGEYTLEFWHEEYGTKSATVTIEDGQEAEVSVTFSA
jgi:plastocyanin